MVRCELGLAQTKEDAYKPSWAIWRAEKASKCWLRPPVSGGSRSALTLQLCFLLQPTETKKAAHTPLWLVLCLLLNVLTSTSGSQNGRFGWEESVA